MEPKPPSSSNQSTHSSINSSTTTTSSPRKNLIRSFTTSSDLSASEQLEKIVRAREERRLQRGVRRGGDDDDDEDWDLSRDDGDEIKGTTNTEQDQRDLTPKLRVQSSSNRSFTPSIPSSPSRSTTSTYKTTSSNREDVIEEEGEGVGKNEKTTTRSRRPSSSIGSFEIPEIPPYRPKSIPTPASSTSTIPLEASSSPSTTTPQVVLSGGLMERLKRQRAAAILEAQKHRPAMDTETVEKEKLEEAVSMTSGEENEKEEEVEKKVEIERSTVDNNVPSDMGFPTTTGLEQSELIVKNPAASSSDSSSRVERPLSPVKRIRQLFEPSSSEAIPNLSTSTRSSSLVSVDSTDVVFQGPKPQEERGDDTLSELSSPTKISSSTFESPWRATTAKAKNDDETDRGAGITTRSKIFGRNGEEVEYDFTQLSDVLEKSERSSMSTWRDSLVRPLPPNQRNSTYSSSSIRQPNIDRPTSISHSESRSIDDLSLSSYSSKKRNLDDRPPSPSKSTTAISSLGNRKPEDRRIDATSHLVLNDRNGSRSSSIFSETSSTSSIKIGDVGGRRSPTKKTSPEIARRTRSLFEDQGSSSTNSPTKSTFQHQPTRDPSTINYDRIGESLVREKSQMKEEVEEDPIEAIERRREARRVRMDSIKKLYTPFSVKTTTTATTSEGSVRPDLIVVEDVEDRWSEIERREASEVGRDPKEEQKGDVEMDLATLDTGEVKVGVEADSPILCEGYLLIPPVDKTPISDYESPKWTKRYSVLNKDTLSFRPTDQIPLIRPIVVLIISDCAALEQNPPPSTAPSDRSHRPFAVVLKDGERVYFDCEKGSERVRWVLALQDAIAAARLNERNLAYDTLSRLDFAPTELNESKAILPALPPQNDRSLPSTPTHSPQKFKNGDVLLDLDATPGRPPLISVWSSQASPLGSTSTSGFDFRETPKQRPISNSIHSVSTEDRPLPALPTSSSSPSISSGSITPRRIQGHVRSRSDLSLYRTEDDQPPFRPEPTRPKSLYERRFGAGSEGGDGVTMTTRRALDTDSERVDWESEMRKYRTEARLDSQHAPPQSSIVSPTIVRRERDKSSRKLEGLPPLSPGLDNSSTSSSKFGFRLPFDSSNNHKIRHRAEGQDQRKPDRRPRGDPFARSNVVQPHPAASSRFRDEYQTHNKARSANDTLRPFSDFTNLTRRTASSSSLSKLPPSLEELLWRIRDDFEDQRSIFQQDHDRQEQVAQVISSLAKWVAEDRELRETQHQRLAEAVNGIVEHVSTLPQQLLAALQTAETASFVSQRQLPTTDVERATIRELEEEAEETKHLEADEQSLHEAGNEGEVPEDSKGGRMGALAAFARGDRHQPHEGERAAVGDKKDKLKGPRMPGIRLWGAPDPVADRAARWGQSSARNPQVGQDTADEGKLSAESHNNHDDERDTSSNTNDDLSTTLERILQTLQQLGEKQPEIETKPPGLTVEEQAELEAKKAEIARIEAATVMNAERTERINEMVAHLAQKTDKTDALLDEIAKSVKASKTPMMDPALSLEVKKLLGGVQNGVDAHVADFRGKLTSEVQRMFGEVGKLRDEKKTLQTEIAELMAFHARQGGSIPKTLQPQKKEVPSNDPGPSSPPPQSGGSFGPRAMK